MNFVEVVGWVGALGSKEVDGKVRGFWDLLKSVERTGVVEI